MFARKCVRRVPGMRPGLFSQRQGLVIEEQTVPRLKKLFFINKRKALSPKKSLLSIGASISWL